MPTNWTTPRTWTPYEPVTHNLLNTYVRNQFLSVSFLSTRFVCSDTSLSEVTLNLPGSSEALNAEIHIMGRVESGGGALNIQFNASTSGYYRQWHRFGGGTSSAAGAGPSTAGLIGSMGTTAAGFEVGSIKIFIPNHTGAFNAKTALNQSAAFLSTSSTDGYCQQFFVWNQSTAPITTVKLLSAGPFSIGTVFSVYGMP